MKPVSEIDKLLIEKIEKLADDYRREESDIGYSQRSVENDIRKINERSKENEELKRKIDELTAGLTQEGKKCLEQNRINKKRYQTRQENRLKKIRKQEAKQREKNKPIPLAPFPKEMIQ